MANKRSLFREIFEACKEAEEEYRYNERFLEMRLGVFERQNEAFIQLLENNDFSNDEKVARLKTYFGINGK